MKKIERDVEEPDLYNLARCVLRLNPEERKPAALLVNDAWIAADSPIKTNKGKYTRALAVDLHVNTSRGTELTNMSAKARSKFQGNEGEYQQRLIVSRDVFNIYLSQRRKSPTTGTKYSCDPNSSEKC